MPSESDEWRPGSFTKNFSWGAEKEGLRQLHAAICAGFANEMTDVPRELFRERVVKTRRPDFIPMNFFLFNKVIDDESYVIADELVFQALNFRHSARFDRLSLFAFNLSLAGQWKGAKPYQRRPAEWARHYVLERVAKDFNWDASKVTANDVERFVSTDPRYKAEGARKLATNLNYLYSVGHLGGFNVTEISSWWLDALFLALDRIIEDRTIWGLKVSDRQYEQYLNQADFQALAGPRSLQKNLAAKHFVSLYTACGARQRFSDEAARQRTEIMLPDMEWYIANSSAPIGAIHPSNPRGVKAIPRACAMLAKYVGFETIEIDDLEEFDVSAFVREHTGRVIKLLKEQKIAPTMSAEELLKLTRGK